MNHYTYLALGDSYTIGEGMVLAESFPYQAVQLLRSMGFVFCAPEIIAATGWTTGELNAAIDNTQTLKNYSVVSLLIGVNNQYRGHKVHEYAAEFELLLKRGIDFAAGNSACVFVLSIPDWGITPFAADRDTVKISQEIDAYNAANEHICSLYNVWYINITQEQRLNGAKEEFLATDKLHPSGKEYAKWAGKLSESVALALKLNNEQL
jgi:GDSL-like Lipase/Acylhydrolase family